jgi:hypothetical protein
VSRLCGESGRDFGKDACVAVWTVLQEACAVAIGPRDATVAVASAASMMRRNARAGPQDEGSAFRIVGTSILQGRSLAAEVSSSGPFALAAIRSFPRFLRFAPRFCAYFLADAFQDALFDRFRYTEAIAQKLLEDGTG